MITIYQRVLAIKLIQLISSSCGGDIRPEFIMKMKDENSQTGGGSYLTILQQTIFDTMRVQYNSPSGTSKNTKVT